MESWSTPREVDGKVQRLINGTPVTGRWCLPSNREYVAWVKAARKAEMDAIAAERDRLTNEAKQDYHNTKRYIMDPSLAAEVFAEKTLAENTEYRALVEANDFVQASEMKNTIANEVLASLEDAVHGASIEGLLQPGDLNKTINSKEKLETLFRRVAPTDEVGRIEQQHVFKSKADYDQQREQLLEKMGVIESRQAIIDANIAEYQKTIRRLVPSGDLDSWQARKIKERADNKLNEALFFYDNEVKNQLKVNGNGFPDWEELELKADGLGNTSYAVPKTGRTRQYGALRKQSYKWVPIPHHINGKIVYDLPKTIAKVAVVLYNVCAKYTDFVQLNVPFFDGKEIYWRSLSKLKCATIEGIYTFICDRNYKNNLLTKAAATYSDMPQNFRLQFSLDYGFEVFYKLPVVGGAVIKGLANCAARKHPHFVLQDPSIKIVKKKNEEAEEEETADPALKDNCMIKLLQAESNAYNDDHKGECAKTTRRKLNLPPGQISCDEATLQKLADYYHLHIKVTTGYRMPADCDRVYDDDINRSTDRNMCYVPDPELHILSEAGQNYPNKCNILYEATGPSTGHYLRIAQFLSPIKVCSITGDLLMTDEGLPPAMLAERLAQQGRIYYPDQVRESEMALDDHGVCKPIEKLVVFDYETVYRADGKLVPYALAFIVIPLKREGSNRNIDTAKLADMDFGSQYYRDKVVINYGKTNLEVNKPLIDLLKNAPENVHYILLSFNGARFDNFFLANALHHNKWLVHMFATVQGLRGCVIKGGHRTLDLALIIPAMSLKSACAEFNTTPKKVEGFSHSEVQEYYRKGILDDWLRDNRQKLNTYIAGDVLSTLSLAFKVRHALIDVTTNAGKTIDFLSSTRNTPQTIGGFAFEMMKLQCPLPAASSTEEEDRFIRKAITGGRVQVYSGHAQIVEPEWEIIKDSETGTETLRVKGDTGQLRMYDFASLYPTVMSVPDKIAALFPPELSFGMYPTNMSGPPKVWRKDAGEPFNPSAVGMYFVNVLHQNPNKPNVLPKRPDLGDLREDEVIDKAEGCDSLDWAYKESFYTYATHIDIALIRKYGGEVDVLHGLVWENCMRGMFAAFINPLAAKKDEEDVRKKNDKKMYTKIKAEWISNETRYREMLKTWTGTQEELDAVFKAETDEAVENMFNKLKTGNAAMRMVYKLLQNAASGKCCQANYEERVVLADGLAAQLHAEASMDPNQDIIWYPIGGNTCVIVGRKPAKQIYKPAKAKPSICAVLIYSYSRALVYETLCQHNVLYSDTDSGLFRANDAKKLMSSFPSLDFKNYVRKVKDLTSEERQNIDQDLLSDPEAELCKLGLKGVQLYGRNKSLGDLEEELTDGGVEFDHATAYLIAPKNYAVFLKDKNGNMLKDSKGNTIKNHKIRSKGVNMRTDRLIKDPRQPGDSKPNPNLAILEGMSIDAMSEEIVNTSHELTEPLQLSDESFNPEVVERFFRNQATGVETQVFCSQLTRSFKSDFSKNESAAFQLTQRFLIKTIKSRLNTK